MRIENVVFMYGFLIFRITGMDLVKKKLVALLPDIEQDTLLKLYQVLEDIGVQSAADMSFIEEKDMVEVLKPIQVRKLLKSWKAGRYFDVYIPFSEWNIQWSIQNNIIVLLFSRVW